MAKSLTAGELRAALQSSEQIQKNGFAVLKAITELLNDDQQSALGHDMVLRALDQRENFGPLRETLNSIAQSVGLYPYVDSPEKLGVRETIAYEYHRPLNLPSDIVFHREQAEVYHLLLAGHSIILSAPTSFGKSKIIDAILAAHIHDNIVIVVPTLALIDETRRRVAAFCDRYKIVTHLSQLPAERNIFVFTAERAVTYERFPEIDFFVIDEFYKIGDMKGDKTRTVALNQAFYKLWKQKAQFYLLGPNIREIPEGVQKTYSCVFRRTECATVAADQIRVAVDDDPLESLVALATTLTEPTLIFCGSPPKANAVAIEFVKRGIGIDANDLKPCADWTAETYHPDWIFGEALTRGIGIHHGKLPRALSQYVVRCFNDDKLRFLICTSTLIEGVNTKAKNVIIYDNKIAARKIDYFTFNNIKGRSGRMFQHFVGKIYLFSEPPQKELPFVDFPLLTQDATSPESLLIQLEHADLTKPSRDRLKKYSDEKKLPLELIRANASIEPAHQVEFAEAVRSASVADKKLIAWRGFPKFDQLAIVSELIWTHFVRSDRRNAGVASGRQLAFKIMRLSEQQSVAERVRTELTEGGGYAADDPNEAVERVLDFDRTWAGFDFPRYLAAASRIQEYVLGQERLPTGEYLVYATRVECHFRTPVIAALDEYGIPVQVSEKIQHGLHATDDLDAALDSLRRLDVRKLGRLTRFERDVILDAQSSLRLTELE